MEGFTMIDGIVAATIVISALLAYSRGFVREALSIAGWIVAGIVGFAFAAPVRPLMTQIPYVGDIVSSSCEIGLIAAFAAVFAVALVIVSLITPIFSSMVQRSRLGGLDQGLGFLFGVLRGIVLVAVAFFVYNTIYTAKDLPMVDESRSAAVFSRMTGQVASNNPEQALGWITQQYEGLVGQCGS